MNSVKEIFNPPTPYDQYINALEKAEIDETPMAKAWKEAGLMVFTDSIIVDLPYTETGYFQKGEPEARSYRFASKKGQILTIQGQVQMPDNAKIFLDLFTLEGDSWVHKAHGDSALFLNFEFSNNVECLLRIQPELLVHAYYSINIGITPVLVNPVSGATNKSIGSFYGAARDGGKRSHEGIDIFAPRGTPVIAPTNGYISRTGTNNLGGKVVWMQDMKRGHSYYFAHLDSQYVKAGNRVRQGDTIGTVGNTGNAKNTPPHLHFGIYQRGSIDPINYVRTMEKMVETLPLDTNLKELSFKVNVKTGNLRAGPGIKKPIIRTLKKDSYLKVMGTSGDWYRIILPDYQQGFIAKNIVASLDEGKVISLPEPSIIYSEIGEDAIPVSYLEDGSSVEVLAAFNDWLYVKTGPGLLGWLNNSKEKA